MTEKLINLADLKARDAKVAAKNAANSEQDKEVRAPAFSEEALALEFAKLYADRFRYVAVWSKWLHWTGRVWVFDTTLATFEVARRICRSAAVKCDKDNIAKTLASARTSAAVARLGSMDRAIAATTDQWDRDAWLLNTPGGVIDLQSGDRRQHSLDDYMTKVTAAESGGQCPIWLQFLNRVFTGDQDLIGFVQRVTGYALTGDTSAHALFFLYGTGANGKSVFTSTLAGVLGDYQHTAPIETFTASNTDRHPTELAGLRGARLVTAVETEEGRRWAESRIKALTGGDPISARFMRQDFFEFTPQFKLVIAGNHKPGLRSVDEAIRRRFHLIPFTVTIPAEERDPQLTEKLKSEWPGILQWMIDGCLDWQTRGLNPPDAVKTATAAYLDAQDAVSAWIEEQCEPADPDAFESTTDLFLSWKAWAVVAGEYVGTQTRFTAAIETRGFVYHRNNTARGYKGHRLKQTNSDDEWW